MEQSQEAVGGSSSCKELSSCLPRLMRRQRSTSWKEKYSLFNVRNFLHFTLIKTRKGKKTDDRWELNC